MGTEAALEFLIELVDDAKERFRRDGFFQCADLVDAFLRAGLVVFQQVLHGAVALCVPGFLIPGVLQQRRDRVREVFNDTFDYDAMLHACSTLPQLLEFVDFATDYAEARQGCRQAQGRAQIDRILSFIHKNLPRSIGRAEIARAVYLNPEYLSRLFKKEMGIGLNDYLVQERMKIAQSLLKNTSFSISIVASKVGYINFSAC